MKVELQVLASPTIKRKKPWPRLAFLGQVDESLFLLDSSRLSVLYVKSGKTKRKIPRLSPILPNVVTLNHSKNGHFLSLLTQNGSVSIWHKDSDIVRTIPPLPELALLLEDVNSSLPVHCRPHIYLSDDARRVLVVVSCCLVYVWEGSEGVPQFANSVRLTPLAGTWSQVLPDDGLHLPAADNHDLSIHASFYTNEVVGDGCCCSFVFTEGANLHIVTLYVRWHLPLCGHSDGRTPYVPAWQAVINPIDQLVSGGRVVGVPGSLLGRHSHNGHLLAVAVNQDCTSENRILFISTLANAALVGDLKGCGAKAAVRVQQVNGSLWAVARNFWVADMQWLYNDLLLVCISGQGSVAVVSRLGEPLLIHCDTTGSGAPRHFLPLHPLLSISGVSDGASWSNNLNPMRQRFSVCCHPRLPVIVSSDGYVVSVMSVPGDVSTHSVMRGLILESDRHLAAVRQSSGYFKKGVKMDSLRQSIDNLVAYLKRAESKERLRVTGRGSLQDLTKREASPEWRRNSIIRFESEPEDGLNSPNDSADEDLQAVTELLRQMSTGKITFSADDMAALAEDVGVGDGRPTSPAHCLYHAQCTLQQAWSLAASHTDPWTVEHEHLATYMALNTARFFELVINCPPSIFRELAALQAGRSPDDVLEDESKFKPSDKLDYVLDVLKLLLSVLQFDKSTSHLLSAGEKLVRQTVTVVLSGMKVALKNSRLKTYQMCCSVLEFSECHLYAVYNNKNVVLSASQARMKREDHYNQTDNSDEELEGTTSSKQPLSADNISNITPLLFSRFTSSWTHIYDDLITYADTLLDIQAGGKTLGAEISAAVASKLLRNLQPVITYLQTRLQALGSDFNSQDNSQEHWAVHPGVRLFLNDQHDEAIIEWLKTLANQKDLPANYCSRLLLAVTCTLLRDYRIRSALEFVELLVSCGEWQLVINTLLSKQPSDREAMLSWATTLPEEVGRIEVTEVVKEDVVLHILQHVARLMASYFTNTSLIFTSPFSRSALSQSANMFLDDHVIELARDTLSVAVRELGEAWSVPRTLQYLLVAGLFSDAVHFAHTLGDWKTAFMLAVAVEERTYAAPFVYARNKALVLPPQLQPTQLLREQLMLLLQWDPKESKTDELMISADTDRQLVCGGVRDMLLAATLCHIDLTPWLLASLLTQLHGLCHTFPLLVPHNIYLPAPPLYCPQPVQPHQEGTEEEVRLRVQVSTVVQLLLMALESSHTALPAARWYYQMVVKAVDKARLAFHPAEAKLSDSFPHFEEFQKNFLRVPSPFSGLEQDTSVHSVLAWSRDLLSLLWMLSVRDELSLALRRKAAAAESKMRLKAVSDADWHDCCTRVLHWALHMLPFAAYLNAESDVYAIIMSCLLELPPSEDSACCLAEHCADPDSLPADIQDKLAWIIRMWQGVDVFTDSDNQRKTKASLSILYHKHAQNIRHLNHKRMKIFGHYEPFVFAGDVHSVDSKRSSKYSSNGIGLVGSRPFESSVDFVKFLDIYGAVALGKLLEAEREQTALNEPLILQSSEELRQKELHSLVNHALMSFRRTLPDMQTSTSTSPAVDVKDKKLLPRLASINEENDDLTHKPAAPESPMGLQSAWTLLDIVDRKPPLSSQNSVGTLELTAQKNKLSMKDSSVRTKSSINTLRQDTLSLIHRRINRPWKFDGQYEEVELLLEWLVRWSSRTHHLGKKNIPSPAVVRVPVSPQVIVYTLWAVEHRANPHLTSAASVPSSVSRGNRQQVRESDSEDGGGEERGGRRRVTPKKKKQRVQVGKRKEEKSAAGDRGDTVAGRRRDQGRESRRQMSGARPTYDDSDSSDVSAQQRHQREKQPATNLSPDRAAANIRPQGKNMMNATYSLDSDDEEFSAVSLDVPNGHPTATQQAAARRVPASNVAESTTDTRGSNHQHSRLKDNLNQNAGETESTLSISSLEGEELQSTLQSTLRHLHSDKNGGARGGGTLRVTMTPAELGAGFTLRHAKDDEPATSAPAASAAAVPATSANVAAVPATSPVATSATNAAVLPAIAVGVSAVSSAAVVSVASAVSTTLAVPIERVDRVEHSADVPIKQVSPLNDGDVELHKSQTSIGSSVSQAPDTDNRQHTTRLRKSKSASGRSDSSAAGMAGELRDVIRSELRLILQAQHHGIMAVLGALDSREDDEGVQPLPVSTKAKKPKRQYKQGGKGGRGRESKKRDSESSELDASYEQSIDVSGHGMENDEVRVRAHSAGSEGPMSVLELHSASQLNIHSQHRHSSLSHRHQQSAPVLSAGQIMAAPLSSESRSTLVNEIPSRQAWTDNSAPGFFPPLVPPPHPEPMFLRLVPERDNESLPLMSPSPWGVRNEVGVEPQRPLADMDDVSGVCDQSQVPGMPLLRLVKPRGDQLHMPPLPPDYLAPLMGVMAGPAGVPLLDDGIQVSDSPLSLHQPIVPPGLVFGAPLPLLSMPEPVSRIPAVTADQLIDYDRRAAGVRLLKDERPSGSPTNTSLNRNEMPVHAARSEDKNSNNNKQQEVISKSDASHMTDHLHQGYALTQGMFDDYLGVQHELGAAEDNFAKLQYRAAVAMKRREDVSLKLDVATSTDKLQEKISLTSDTGTEPVQEAASRYYRPKPGHDLPAVSLAPDVLLDGLSFAGTVSGQPLSSRGYLNVIDIDADVLNDIVPTSDKPADVRQKVSADVKKTVKLQEPEQNESVPLEIKKLLDARERSRERAALYLKDMDRTIADIDSIAQRAGGRDMTQANNGQLSEHQYKADADVEPLPGYRRELAQAGHLSDRSQLQTGRDQPSDDRHSVLTTPTPATSAGLPATDQVSHDNISGEEGARVKSSIDLLLDDILGADRQDPGRLRLAQALRASQDGMELSNDDLQEVLAALTPRRKQQQPASTAHWAHKTKAERMQTYRTDKNARLAKASQGAAVDEKTARRQEAVRKNTEKRMHVAAELMHDILASEKHIDKAPGALSKRDKLLLTQTISKPQPATAPPPPPDKTRKPLASIEPSSARWSEVASNSDLGVTYDSSRQPHMIQTYAQRQQHWQSSDIPYSSRQQEHRQAAKARHHAPRKVLTYAQMLQQLQPAKNTARTPVTKPTVRPAGQPLRHKPAHKPKTYVQQLRELQKPATAQPRGPPARPQPYRTPGQPQPGWGQQPAGRAQSRPGQPAAAADRERQWAGVAHRDYDDDDDLSSKWSLDDNVRRLLYDDRSVSGVGTRPSSALTLTDMDDYTASVDLHDIEKIADDISVSGASLPSVLDWDVIDDLISSVQ